jgi:hypothetical protein
MTKDKKKPGSEPASPKQKNKFKAEKAKQVEPNEDHFDADSDEDTTGKSEVFAKKELHVKKPGTHKK